jgi:chromosome segregation ATPase
MPELPRSAAKFLRGLLLFERWSPAQFATFKEISGENRRTFRRSAEPLVSNRAAVADESVVETEFVEEPEPQHLQMEEQRIQIAKLKEQLAKAHVVIESLGAKQTLLTENLAAVEDNAWQLHQENDKLREELSRVKSIPIAGGENPHLGEAAPENPSQTSRDGEQDGAADETINRGAGAPASGDDIESDVLEPTTEAERELWEILSQGRSSTR